LFGWINLIIIPIEKIKEWKMGDLNGMACD
jgi:hypothetical protein